MKSWLKKLAAWLLERAAVEISPPKPPVRTAIRRKPRKP